MVIGYAIVCCHTYEEAERLNNYWENCGYDALDESEEYLWYHEKEDSVYFLDDWGDGKPRVTYGNYSDINVISSPSKEEYEFVGEFDEYASLKGLGLGPINVDVSDYL